MISVKIIIMRGVPTKIVQSEGDSRTAKQLERKRSAGVRSAKISSVTSHQHARNADGCAGEQKQLVERSEPMFKRSPITTTATATTIESVR